MGLALDEDYKFKGFSNRFVDSSKSVAEFERKVLVWSGIFLSP